jgi:hypothetical protein
MIRRCHVLQTLGKVQSWERSSTSNLHFLIVSTPFLSFDHIDEELRSVQPMKVGLG